VDDGGHVNLQGPSLPSDQSLFQMPLDRFVCRELPIDVMRLCPTIGAHLTIPAKILP